MDALPELVDQLRIGQRTVAGIGPQAMPFDQAVEVVAVVFRVQGPRQLDGAGDGAAEIDAQAPELVLQETVVEARVVGDEQATPQATQGFSATSANGGAAATMSLVMPVSCSMKGGFAYRD
jgi:hypothetical protein